MLPPFTNVNVVENIHTYVKMCIPINTIVIIKHLPLVFKIGLIKLLKNRMFCCYYDGGAQFFVVNSITISGNIVLLEN